MNRALEVYFLAGIPITLCFVAMALARRGRRVRWLAMSLVPMGCWVAALSWLHTRSVKIQESNISRTEQALQELGRPDLIVDFAEGDSLWMYAVRVWPWNESLGLNVYRGRVLAGRRWHEAGFFFEPITKRTEEESTHVKAFLALQDSAPALPSKAQKK